MNQVDIYINQTHKAPKETEGAYQYLISMMTSKGPADSKGFGVVMATAHEAELIAIEEALKRFKASCRLRIHSEHGYFASVISNGWMDKWKMNDYKNAKGIRVSHAERLEAINKLLGNHEIEDADKNLGEYASWMQSQIELNYRNYKKGEIEHVKRFWRV